MDENLTRHADSQIPGNGVIPQGFHTKWPELSHYPILIPSIAAATSATLNLTALPILK